ncbi:FAD-dependent oxidoreductase [Ferrimonas senticii]|uniref:FAD-dependent oxidoreductase n=1 Tax=Ferrimonas senticii TaxID=394566 RepID=UPI0004843EE0|nr:FAD-dependent oxidoreductase [Ferrimonas senticii]
MTVQTDVMVVGGGMVGAAAALGLAQQGWQVILFEAQQPQSFTPQQPLDLRVSAVSAASERLLTQLGAWGGVMAMRAAPYRTLATWELPERMVSFDAADLGHAHLGHIIENRVVQLALWQQLESLPNVTVVLGLPQSITQVADYAEVVVDGVGYRAPLLLGCDGAQSKVRQAANIGVSGWHYRQHCLIINIDTEAEQQQITWQQFSPSGPRALLPLPGKHASLVWYDSPARISELKRLDNAALKQQIIQAFPAERLGEFEVVRAASFPLTRQHANHYFQGRMVLLGDAAHTINPLAGQGVNLGFKDVAALLALLATADVSELHADPQPLLTHYQRQRRPDNLRMQAAMDLFYQVFSNDFGPLKLARNLTFSLANNAGPIKHQVMRYAMGL